jgi:ATP-dependent RNA circularization protein (DNA/RNA ligase family)
MTLADAHKLTLKVLKQVMEEKLDEHNVQLAQVRSDPFALVRSTYADPARRSPRGKASRS